MEPPLGTRDEAPAESDFRPLFAVGRMVGFVLLTGAAMAVLAVVVLAPAYARTMAAKTELEKIQASIADAEAQIAANERLINDLPEDEVLTKRLMKRQYGWQGRGETLIQPRSATGPSAPSLVIVPRHPQPTPPSGFWMTVADKVLAPSTRRGLLLLAAGAMLTAMFLFSPPDKYKQARKS